MTTDCWFARVKCASLPRVNVIAKMASKGKGMRGRKSKKQCAPEELPSAKRTRKMLNKKERESIFDYLNSVEDSVMMGAVCDRLQEQSFPENLNSVVEVLCDKDHHLKDILAHHRKTFAQMDLQCKKGVDPFLCFQLRWHQHCSAYLLARSYPLSVINMTEALEHSLVTTRMQWLDFYEANSVPVPESNAVMMTVSSAVYELMLERAGDIKNSLSDEAVAVPAAVTDAVEGDNVYLRFTL